MILAKKISRKEGESPRKKEIPLRLSYFASLREQKKNVSLSAAADWTRRLGAFARKNRSRKEGKTPKSRLLCVSAPLREFTFFKKSIGNTVEIA